MRCRQMSHRPAASRVWLAVAWAGPFAFVGARVSGVRCGVSTTFHACLSSSIYVCLVLINWFRLVSVGRRMPFLPAKVPELVSVAGGLLHSSFTVRLSSQRKLGKSGRKVENFSPSTSARKGAHLRASTHLRAGPAETSGSATSTRAVGDRFISVRPASRLEPESVGWECAADTQACSDVQKC
jgi:hypothetical protein